MRLMEQTSLTFSRYGEETKDDWGFPVESTPVDVPTRGSLQPLSYGDRQKILPEGYWTADSRIYYTKTKLRNADTTLQLPPDECTIDGKKFLVLDAGDWATNMSRLAHYKVILVAKEPT